MRSLATEDGAEAEPEDPRAAANREDDINWKMSSQQQVTPTTTTTAGTEAPTATERRRWPTPPVDGENNPIKSLRRQQHCDITVDPTDAPDGSVAPETDRPRGGLRRMPAIGYDDDGDTDGVEDPRNGERESANNNHVTVDAQDEPALERNQHKTINARRRWKLLAKALRHDSSEEDQFSKFNLIEADRVGDEKYENVYVYRLYDRYRVKIRLIGPERPWTATELIGFNNTGNICVWPSEEALAYYVLARLAQFDGTRVLELGGGMTCLAGLVLAKYGQPAFVHVSDGNELSVENVRKSLVLNKFNCTIKSSVLKWDRSAVGSAVGPAEPKYQFILSADCLFFDESRSQLIDTVWLLLAEEGVALVTAPRRGNTLGLFLNECVARGFHYELLQCYNEAIWARHLELKLMEGYDENIHYPLLVKLYKYAHGSVLHRLL
ncbi:calmodulin-lysine N-methyltransferase [Anopheles cruzii]|uniref:calmodulin-lysine N-methyltransferase n=1 Tax=Anopheles cruzii TaxID=68878 RepID=UPI0022EC645B|nr:calmodulin-lysine N-methyltransferase [Anopheles cruzii]XP_052865110.1 calmodulin-lysine N-methyltransferase [Anopheles cruzii]